MIKASTNLLYLECVMANVKRILVIDDHFEMLEFLRSMLELSDQDYEVLAVPSAEEGFFEVKVTHFDLIITDVRLPGMSGFDLVRRVRRLGHKTPIIMITAYSSAQGKKEADELGVYRLFMKPLDTDSVLTAVRTALYGDSVKSLKGEVSGIARPVEKTAVSSSVQKRLQTLRTDTGAMQLILATVEGDVVFTVGNGNSSGQPLDLPALAAIIARNIKDSYLLANTLGSVEPFTLQYHAGERIELYCANIGKDYFLTMFFDASSRRGRIGTIWVFTQRAIKDLLTLLNLGDEATLNPVVEDSGDMVEDFLQNRFDSLMETAVSSSSTASTSETELPVVPVDTMPILDVEESTAPRLELEPMDVDDAELLALLGGGADKKSDAVDLDAFWDDVSSEEEASLSRGLTLEEAKRQGLISTDLEADES